MPSSWVEVANSALIKLGSSTILSLDDATKGARLCKQRLEPLRRKMLSEYPWKSAKARVILAPSVTAPVFGYTYTVPLPGDCIRVLMVNGVMTGYRIEKRDLLINSNTVELEYVKDVTDPVQIPDYVGEVLAMEIANDICIALTNDKDIKEELVRDLRLMKRKIKSLDSQQQADKELVVDTFINSRSYFVEQPTYRQ